MGRDHVDFEKIEDELVQQRSTVEKVADKGGGLLEDRIGHADEIDKGEHELASFLDKKAENETK